MAENIKKEVLSLDDTQKVNKDGRPILGKLSGPCADFIMSTRNDRMYDEELWTKVFNDPIIKEYFECGGIPGELDHPADRTETCSEKIAIMMPEPPKKDKEGHLVATFDILDTPNGRIAYTLAKYGYKLGISSRGSGDTYVGNDGKEHVDADTYDFQAFDLVLLPAVKAARMNFTESLNTNKKVEDVEFKKAICEALEKSNDDEKKIMQETLNRLNINYNSNKTETNIDVVNEDVAAGNTGASIIKELQKTLLENVALNNQIRQLQEQLSVCYTKEEKLKETVTDLDSCNKQLNEAKLNIETLSEKIEKIEEGLDDKDAEIYNLNQVIKELKEAAIKNKTADTQLTESLSIKDKKITELNSKLKAMSESLETSNQTHQNQVQSLNESIEEMRKDQAIKRSEFNTKLQQSKELSEKYRSVAKTAVSKYIGVRATMLGVDAQVIVKRLGENYSFNDIDQVCEDLKAYNLSMTQLPFDTSKKIRMNVTESKKSSAINTGRSSNFDDEPDTQLFQLARLDK